MKLTLCHKCAELYKPSYNVKQIGNVKNVKCDHCGRKRSYLQVYEVKGATL